MTTQVKIWLSLLVTVAFVLLGLWQLANARGAKARGRRRSQNDPDANGLTPQAIGQRRSDKRQLTNLERKLFAESQRLLSQGKVSAGARILEQLSMPREAIQALEDHGMIHEAARILMRMQKHNRAGVVYARHGMWDHAFQSFRMANMPLEAAKCAREAGNMEQAAEFFTKSERYEDAAECFASAGDFLQASRLYNKAKNENQAMEMLERAASKAENITALALDESEIANIVSHLGQGAKAPNLARAAASRNRLTPAILSLVSQGLMNQACDLFNVSLSDIGPSLMAEVNYQNRDAGILAQIFMRLEKFHYAGMIYERLGNFDLAGDAFERAADLDRAIYCYERGQLHDKVKLLKTEAAGNDSSVVSGKKQSSVNTHRTHGKTNGQPKGHFSQEDMESTKVISSTLQDAKESSAEDKENVRSLSANVTKNTKEASQPLPERIGGVFSLGIAEDTVTDEPLTHLPSETSAPTDLPTSVSDSSDQGELQAFERCNFLMDFSDQQKHQLWQLGERLNFNTGDVVLQYEESPMGLYVITKGVISCFRKNGNQETFLESIGPGDSFGELWLLTDLPTTVCFRAIEASTLRVIPRNRFSSFLEQDGVIARKVYKNFTSRLLRSLLKSQNSQKNQVAS